MGLWALFPYDVGMEMRAPNITTDLALTSLNLRTDAYCDLLGETEMAHPVLRSSLWEVLPLDSLLTPGPGPLWQVSYIALSNKLPASF